MAKQIKCILINVDNVLISEIIELPSELGEPDCKLVKPHKFFIDGSLKPWLGDINPTDQTFRWSGITSWSVVMKMVNIS